MNVDTWLVFVVGRWVLMWIRARCGCQSERKPRKIEWAIRRCRSSGEQRGTASSLHEDYTASWSCSSRWSGTGGAGKPGEIIMPQFVIERHMPGIGDASAADLKVASQTSCDVLRDLGPEIQWVHSYVTDATIYCIYRAPNEKIIREHAKRGGFPADSI